jgi:hypothetical protein
MVSPLRIRLSVIHSTPLKAAVASLESVRGRIKVKDPAPDRARSAVKRRRQGMGRWESMGRWFVVLTMLGGVAAGCASDADGSPGGGDENLPKAIGAVCATDSECASGNCTPSRVCSKSCDMHADCGCPAGTTNGDIVGGRCRFGCFESMCTVPCTSDIDCAGDTECTSSGSWDGCL